MTEPSRRQFLQTTSGTVAAVLAAPYVIADESKGANDRIGVGFIGVGGRCGAHLDIINKFKAAGTAQPVAVCDVYRPRLIAASQKTGNT
ncbi:MAG: twin-arginine translocation signal domain-containing protein, partial [Planctomycetaceae bacterium]|nr:twin-arginine translocation signal domain-containing protein [Planctomycetaceae bacterium]